MSLFPGIHNFGLNTWDHLASIIQATVVSAGGMFAIWKFYRFTEASARLTFKVDLLPRAKVRDHYICEVIATIENVGNVGVTVRFLKFSLRGFKRDDPFDEKSKYKYLEFPWLIKEGRWLKDTFIEPKSSQEYSHVCAIPAEFAAILVLANTKYADTSNQPAQKVVVLSESE